ncbi:hypothetical protein PYW07_017006 [Mythimna separata]|uniref:N-acetyltransferase domain-containing protein n=1 Tax=Mythimna separata TaxID=271217 RepID=A0AAD7YWD1_MYTSE|nr:hypothetical protein PYW07_017006 [Mythimna separata]
MKLYINHFVKEENTFIAAGVPENEKAIEEVYEPILESFGKDGFHIVICCLDNDDDEIKVVTGASLMSLVSKGDPGPDFDFKTKELKKFSEILHGLEAKFNEMKEFDLERCFGDRGLFVCPEYRGLGIAQELLKVRRLICKENEIPINGAWMTSYGTQKAAERDGWETVCEVQYEDLGQKYGVTFTKEPPSTKFMVARIQL